jgi:hypothetical protein
MSKGASQMCKFTVMLNEAFAQCVPLGLSVVKHLARFFASLRYAQNDKQRYFCQIGMLHMSNKVFLDEHKQQMTAVFNSTNVLIFHIYLAHRAHKHLYLSIIVAIQ